MDPHNTALLREAFQNRPADTHTRQWDELWRREVTPWDRNGPSLALRDAITSNQAIFGSPGKDSTNGRRKRALVPGCGRGYDVLLLASLGYDTYGLDASATALEAATKMQQESVDDERYAANDPTIGRGTATFVNEDFFKDDFLSKTDGADFDVVFDYTFLCALPPELRPSWAKRHSELLAPTGHLICLEWPLAKDPKEGGPPHGLSSELYVQLFRYPGEEVKYDGAGQVVANTTAGERANALIRLAHSRPDRTHAAGKDTDYVSIWGTRH